MICHKDLVKHGFYICHHCKKSSVNLNKISYYLFSKTKTRHPAFIDGLSTILNTAIKYYTYFTRFASMIYTMTKDKSSFTLFDLLNLFFSILFLDHIFRQSSLAFVTLIVSDEPFIDVLQSFFRYYFVLCKRFIENCKW